MNAWLPAIVICFVFSLNAQTLSNWMSESLDQSLTLKNITIPGAHDASVYRCFDCTVGANVKNTQTQYLPVEQLLDSGIRYFDIRPIYDQKEFYTGHYTRYDKRPSFGCKGDSLSRLLNEVRKFSQTHNEVVILHLSHYNNRNWNSMEGYFDSLFHVLEKTLGPVIFKKAFEKRLSDIPISELSGKVVILFSDFKGKPLSDRNRGFFSSTEDVFFCDKYSNTTDSAFMMNDQKEKFLKWKNRSVNKEELFVMPWTLTHNAKAAMRCSVFRLPWKKGISIIQFAQSVKSVMHKKITSWVSEGLIDEKNKPNILNVDIADGEVTRLCIQLNKISKSNEQQR